LLPLPLGLPPALIVSPSAPTPAPRAASAAAAPAGVPFVPHPVVILAAFLARRSHGGFGISIFVKRPLAFLRGPLLGLAFDAFVRVVKTAFIIEDNIIRSAVFRIFHRL
jgi:hypothetical protein